MKRKIICVLLCVFMILPMFGAFVTGAAAAEVWTNVTVTSWEDLCTQL